MLKEVAMSELYDKPVVKTTVMDQPALFEIVVPEPTTLCMDTITWPSGKTWICSCPQGHEATRHYYERLS